MKFLTTRYFVLGISQREKKNEYSLTKLIDKYGGKINVLKSDIDDLTRIIESKDQKGVSKSNEQAQGMKI